MRSNLFLPDEFLQSMQNIMPKHLDMEAFIEACQRPLRKSIRVNTLKISVDAFRLKADSLGLTLDPIPWCKEGFWLADNDDEQALGNSAEHLAGLFYIQEASSMMPVSALFADIETPPECVLDMAAAPGSKTTQIAACMNNNGLLVANEYSGSRIKVLHANIERCGIKNVAMTQFDGRVFGGWLPEQFDTVLIDAPCSGEGIIRKDADALKNWNKQAIQDMASVQRDLIVSAFQALKPGGTMVYSTCTLSREENHDICHYLAELFGDAVEFISLENLFPGAEQAVSEEGFLHIFPQIYDCEGFFVAKLRKVASVPSPEVHKRLGKFPFTKASSKQTAEINAALNKTLALDLPVQHQLWLRDKEVWLFPERLEPLLSELKFSRMGIKIADAHNKGYRWHHQVATALASAENSVELTTDEAREWFMGRDVRPEYSGEMQGEVIVSYQEMVIGLGKWVGNRIKNGLPRELVKDKTLF